VAVWHRPAPGAARLVAGTADTGEQWLGERYEIGASTFLQVNRPTGEVLHARVLELAGQPVDSVIDAYAGVGVYGRALARSARRVVAIEVDPVAADAARAEAPPGLTVLVGRVEDRLSEGLPAELVILNPPRSGLHPDVPDMLVRAAPSRVIYVSCDPATLARDVARLAPVFETVRVEVFDLFPQTAHVETVALLVARERD
jgi:23S rRNA (uracil1939-C5)-methyltransferase